MANSNAENSEFFLFNKQWLGSTDQWVGGSVDLMVNAYRLAKEIKSGKRQAEKSKSMFCGSGIKG